MHGCRPVPGSSVPGPSVVRVEVAEAARTAPGAVGPIEFRHRRAAGRRRGGRLQVRPVGARPSPGLVLGAGPVEPPEGLHPARDGIGEQARAGHRVGVMPRMRLRPLQRRPVPRPGVPRSTASRRIRRRARAVGSSGRRPWPRTPRAGGSGLDDGLRPSRTVPGPGIVQGRAAVVIAPERHHGAARQFEKAMATAARGGESSAGRSRVQRGDSASDGAAMATDRTSMPAIAEIARQAAPDRHP